MLVNGRRNILAARQSVDDTVIHHGNSIGHRHGFDLIVGDVHRGRLDAIVQTTQLGAHQVAELGIERAERLVHHEGLGAAHDRAPERHALAVAAREALHRPLQQVFDAQQLRHFRDAALDFRARHALALERKADVLSHLHVRIEREQLEYESDVALRGALIGHIVAVEQNFFTRRQLETASWRSVVVLPQPEGPSSTKNSPSGMVNACVTHGGESPKRFCTLSNLCLSHVLHTPESW